MTLQWIGFGVAVVAIVGVLFWIGRDWGGQPIHGGGSGHGAPADAPAVIVDGNDASVGSVGSDRRPSESRVQLRW